MSSFVSIALSPTTILPLSSPINLDPSPPLLLAPPFSVSCLSRYKLTGIESTKIDNKKEKPTSGFDKSIKKRGDDHYKKMEKMVMVEVELKTKAVEKSEGETEKKLMLMAEWLEEEAVVEW
ncbi:hypothetical protein ISN44_As09g023880 [Arabidopsis suecica]|uniref:Uncharacterized protein n=1 Tax=Arabidopsis suecica TaxID=45249 RepID=A0A8T2AQK0_ARASU|nr:hypothetical protein ISN44_As09g023880 [Arabidopsis suecica]